MGHTEMWAAMTERDAIYANPETTEDDYIKAAELEAKFAEYDDYTAETRAAELLSGVGISEDSSSVRPVASSVKSVGIGGAGKMGENQSARASMPNIWLHVRTQTAVPLAFPSAE